MRYKLCIIFMLLVTVLAGCTNTVAVTAPDLTSSTAETANVSNPEATTGVSNPAGVTNTINPIGTTNVSSPTGAADAASASETTIVYNSAVATNATNPSETTGISNPSETANVSNPAGTTDVSAIDKPNESTPDGTSPEEMVPAEAPHTVQDITISAIGDIITHDNLLEDVKNGDKYDFDPPFSEVISILQSADLAIGNLETPIAGAEAGYGATSGYHGYPKFNTPDSMLDTLKKTGLDVLITANNHCLDRGTAGLVRTIDQLDERGILHTGTYKTEEDSQKILVTDVKGIKIAILAYSYSTNGQPIKEPCVANLLKLDKMLSDVKKAKELKPDIIITYLHFGDEYERQPNSQQKSIADSLIKAGVDIVMGDHPHVLQPMERKTVVDNEGQEREGLVIYSLGNFTTGYTIPYSNTTGIFNIGIEKDMATGKVSIKGTELIPTWIQLYKKDGRNSYRIMTISSAIEKYENKTDEYITEKDYEFLKSRLPELINHVNKGPIN